MRQEGREERAAFVRDRDVTAGASPDGVAHEREAEAASSGAGRRLRREAVAENLVDEPGVDTRPGIVDADEHAGILVSDRDLDPPAAGGGDGVERVVDQVAD